MKRVFSCSRTAILTAAASFAVALVFVTPADAAPIRFDNPAGPGHFEWTTIAGQEFLDITQDAASQPGVSGNPATYWRVNVLSSNTIRGFQPGTPEERLGLQRVNLDGGGSGPGSFLVGVPFGTTIPTPTGPDLEGFFITGMIERFNQDAGFPSTNLPEGESTYLGVSFDFGSGTQYGWIGVVRTGGEVDAFAWGYETEPGIPIAAGVPEPGTLSLLAIGSAALMRRRKRRARK